MKSVANSIVSSKAQTARTSAPFGMQCAQGCVETRGAVPFPGGRETTSAESKRRPGLERPKLTRLCSCGRVDHERYDKLAFSNSAELSVPKEGDISQFRLVPSPNSATRLRETTQMDSSFGRGAAIFYTASAPEPGLSPCLCSSDRSPFHRGPSGGFRRRKQERRSWTATLTPSRDRYEPIHTT